MSFAVKTFVNPAPARGLSLFTIAKTSYSSPCLPVPFKPLKFNLSYSRPNFLYLMKKETFVRVSVIAAQQEENNPVALEEEEERLDANFNWDASEGDGEGRESVGYVEPNDEAKLYVGNLPYSVDSENLARIFEEAGVVDVAEVIYSKETGQSKGFGFVTMNCVEEAERAVQMFHQYNVDGRPLNVNKAAPKGSRRERTPRSVESSSRIYVGNLPWSVDGSRLEEIFSEYGKVVSARVVSDMETGKSRGFGFVEMSSQAEMNDAISNLDGQTLDGRAIRVTVATDRRRSSF